MLTKLNAGWTYTLLTLLGIIVSVPVVTAERRWGMKWRKQREEKLAEKRRRQLEEEENRRGQANPEKS
jgi:hypothetical protein